MSCAPHRPYLSAIADGELGLVPAPMLAHVRSCRACGREVETHALLTVRLRQAVAPARGRPGPWRRRAAGAAVALALVAAGVGALAVWRGQGDQDRVAA